MLPSNLRVVRRLFSRYKRQPCPDGLMDDDDGEAIIARVNTSPCRAHAWSISIKLLKHAPRNPRLLMRIVGFLNRELLGSILSDYAHIIRQSCVCRLAAG